MVETKSELEKILACENFQDVIRGNYTHILKEYLLFN